MAHAFGGAEGNRTPTLTLGIDGGPWRWPHSTAWYVKDPTGYNIEVALWDGATPMFGP